MAVYEVLTIALAIVLAALSTAAIYYGLLGMSGQVYSVRCSACHHLTLSWNNEPQPSCPRCRHPMLMHPIRSISHPHRRAHPIPHS